MSNHPIYLLGIESSCDETSVAVSCNDRILSNIIASQTLIHQYFGGVVPELASRAHLQKIIPVADEALKKANITKNDLHAVAFTRGPGLMGALLVGVSFAKAFAMALDIPLIEVNHMQGHVLAHFIRQELEVESRELGEGWEKSQLESSESVVQNSEKKISINALKSPKPPFTPAHALLPTPRFPFLCLTVSGGHTQIVRIDDYLDMKVIGETLDDAAGEAFDKAAKILGLDYPGGPQIDLLARQGNPDAFQFPHPKIENYNFSFSGLKTAFLYFIQRQTKADAMFIEKNKADLCASIQKTIVDILINKLIHASNDTGIKEIAIAGGVSANSGLRDALVRQKEKSAWNIYIPKFDYCTDNAAMIAITGYFKYLKKDFSDQSVTPLARLTI